MRLKKFLHLYYLYITFQWKKELNILTGDEAV